MRRVLLTTVAVLLAQAPPAPLRPSPSAPAGCAIVVTRSEGLTTDEAIGVATRVGDALRAAGVPVTLSPSEVVGRAGEMIEGCRGQPACLAGVGRSLGAGAVVSADVSKLFGELALQLAVVDTATASTLTDAAYVGPAEAPALTRQLAKFGRAARAAVEELAAFESSAPQAADAPRQANLTPPSSAADPAQGRRPAPIGAYVVTGGAIAAAATGVVFGALALQAHQQYVSPRQSLPGNLQGTQLTYPEYQQRVSQNGVIAGVAGGLCTVLTATAVYLWLQPDRSGAQR